MRRNPAAAQQSARRAARLARDRLALSLPFAPCREWSEILNQRLRDLVIVDQPLVLISQVQRSGGTLLTQLLDGHPQVHVHPHELYTGYPHKEIWPDLSRARSNLGIFSVLREIPAHDAFVRGYTKVGKGSTPQRPLPFLLPPRLQWEIFQKVAPPFRADDRKYFDAYMTSYFNGWLDNHSLHNGEKRWVTAFTPLLAAASGFGAISEVYPLGRFISIVRDPVSWYASARRHAAFYTDIDRALARWLWAGDATIDAATRCPDRVALISFEQLVLETEVVLKRLTTWLSIEYTPGCLNPTFNTMPIMADSSFPVLEAAVIPEAADRRGELSDVEVATIRRATDSTYEKLTQMAKAFMS